MTLRPFRGTVDLPTLIASGGLATLFVAGIGAYTSLATKIEDRPTEAEVRIIVDDKTLPKYDEILRRLDRIDRQLDRITLLTPAPKER